MKGYVYVLYSLKDKRTYTGSTDDLMRRLREHFKGKICATKNRLLLRLVYDEEFSSLDDAKKKERYYKCCSGRKKLAIILANKLPMW